MPTGHNASAWRDAAFVTAAENTDNRASIAQTVKNLNVCQARYVLLRKSVFHFRFSAGFACFWGEQIAETHRQLVYIKTDLSDNQRRERSECPQSPFTRNCSRTVFPVNLAKNSFQNDGTNAAVCPNYRMLIAKKTNFSETRCHQRPVRILFTWALFLQFVGETRSSIEFLVDWPVCLATLDSPELYPLSESYSCAVLI